MNKEQNCDEVPKKRGRGRPRKIDSNQNTENKVKKKRGRKPKKVEQKAVKRRIDYSDDEEDIVLKLPISLKDINRYSNSENSECSIMSPEPYDNSIKQVKDEPKININDNIFTITDMSDGSSSEEEYDGKAVELIERIKDLEAEVKLLKEKNRNYEEIIKKSNNNDHKKIYEMQTDFLENVNNKKLLKDKTDIACWHCTEKFDTPPCILPDKFVNDIYYVYGCFCTWNCVAAYNLSLDDYRVWDRYSLIKKICKKYYDIDDIVPAPPKEFLKKFGGNMNIEEYRNLSIKNDKEFRFILPPMKSIIPLIEQISKDTSMLSKIKSSGLGDNLVLKRSKPLPNAKVGFFETFGKVEKKKRKR